MNTFFKLLREHEYIWIPGILGFGLTILFMAIANLENPATRIETLLTLIGTAFVLYLLAVKWIQRKDATALTTGIILSLAVAFRLIFLFQAPQLSDDINRTIWNGYVSNQGINPYAYAPAAEELRELRTHWTYDRINNKDLPAIYPPLQQILSTVTYWLTGSLWGYKFLFLFFDLGLIAVIYRLLKYLQMDANLVLIYAWSPLVIVEFAWNAHNDVIAIFFLVLALSLYLRSKPHKTSIALAASFLSKFAALIFVPFLTNKQHYLKKLTVAVAIFICIAALGYLPFIAAGGNLFESLRHYGERWEFNASIYPLLYSYISDFDLKWEFTENAARLLSRILLGLVALSAYVFVWIRKIYTPDSGLGTIRAILIILSTLLLINPTLHPWYVTWIIPFLCFIPNAAWLAFSGLVFLSYTVVHKYQVSGIWEENMYVQLAEYIPFYVLLLYSFIRGRFLNRKTA